MTPARRTMQERIITTGSIWIFMGDLYLRLPRQEGPRVDEYGMPRPEWGGPGTGPVQDGVWHRYEQKLFVRDDDQVLLVIEYDDAECIEGDLCAEKHFIRTGAVLEPIVDPESVPMSWVDHQIEYRQRKSA